MKELDKLNDAYFRAISVFNEAIISKDDEEKGVLEKMKDSSDGLTKCLNQPTVNPIYEKLKLSPDAKVDNISQLMK